MISNAINELKWINRTNWELVDLDLLPELFCKADNIFHLILDWHVTTRFMKRYDYACWEDEEGNVVRSTSASYELFLHDFTERDSNSFKFEVN